MLADKLEARGKSAKRLSLSCLLPGIASDEIQALSERLDGTTLEELCAPRRAWEPPRGSQEGDTARLWRQVEKLALKAHAKLPPHKRLPGRKKEVIRALGAKLLRDSFDRPKKKVTCEQFSHALARFKVPGHDSLGQAALQRLWTECDRGDPEALVAMFKDFEDQPQQKIRYKHCRTPVTPPLGCDLTLRAKLPATRLRLDHVFGYAPGSGPNLAVAGSSIVYTSAAVAVVQDGPVTRFFRGHTDDVTCVAVDASGSLGATGQVASAETEPYVCVWSIQDCREVRRFGGFRRLVCAVCFFRDATHLVVVSGDDRHTMFVYDLMSNDEVFVASCKAGVQPPAVTAVAAAPLATCAAFRVRHLLVTVGVGHVAFWLVEDEVASTKRRLPPFRKQRPPALHSVAFGADAVLAGASDGRVYAWRDDLELAFVIDAHRGPCRALALDAKTLYSGGADGLVKTWTSAKGTFELADTFRPTNPHRKKQTPRKKPSTTAARILAAEARADKKRITAFEDMRRTGDRGVSDLVVHDGAVVAGLAFGQITKLGAEETVLQRAHHATTTDLAAHPTRHELCATTGLDCLLCVWDVRRKELHRAKSLDGPATCLALKADEAAVGLADGRVAVYSFEDLELKVETPALAAEPFAVAKYSPDAKLLALGSHDCRVYVLETERFSVRRKLAGHSSYLTHLDFSKDSRVIQSTCGSYELLYWNVATGEQLSDAADVRWHTWTLTLGFPVMGVFPPDSDGTDVNVAHYKNGLVLTGDDAGYVNLFRGPAVCRWAPHYRYAGHSSHCVAAAFLGDGQTAVTTGGRDASVMVWRLVRDNTPLQVGETAVAGAPQALRVS